jgi:hypothetical protein
MGVSRQQARWAFVHDTPPRMPVPVDRSLGPLGLPKPTRQIQGVLEAWPRVSTDEEACGTARHHPRHVGVQWPGETCDRLWPVRALGLSLQGRTVRTGQRGRDALERLPVLTDDWVCCLPIGHAAVETSGQALAWGGRTAATGGIQVALERRTDGSQGVRQAAAGRWSRPPLIVLEDATNGATVIQPDRAGIRRRVGRGGDVLGQLVRRWGSRRGHRGRGNGGGRAGAASPWRQHLAFHGPPPAYCAAPLALGGTLRLQHGRGQVAQNMIDAIPRRAPGKLGRHPWDERLVLV